MTGKWQPEKELVDVTARKRDKIFAELVAEIDPRDSKRWPRVLELFKVLGMRHVMGLDDILSPEQREKAVSLVPLALAYLKPGEILLAAENIALRAPELLLLEDEALSTLEDELVENLKTRDRIELVLLGARAVLGRNPPLPLELETAILTFEELVREDLWRLLPLGQRRSDAIVWAEPSMRKVFWWWALGDDLPETALDDLSTSARIIHVFPGARRELEALIEAERKLDPGGKFSLREFFLKRRHDALCSGKPQEGVFKLAADLGEEILLYREPEEEPVFSLSCDGRKIFIDIEPPHALRAGENPVLEVPGKGRREFLSTQRGRYEAFLEDEIFEAPGGKIKIPLDEKDITLEVPFDR
jgi:hypothetical protein